MTENLPVELFECLAKADALHFGIRQIARDGAHLIHHARPWPGRHRAQLITRRLIRRVSSGDYFQEHLFFSLAPFWRRTSKKKKKNYAKLPLFPFPKSCIHLMNFKHYFSSLFYYYFVLSVQNFKPWIYCLSNIIDSRYTWTLYLKSDYVELYQGI